MEYVPICVRLHPKHLDMIDTYLAEEKSRKRGPFIRYCITYFFEKADLKDKEAFKVFLREIKREEELKTLMHKEKLYREAFKTIRRSGCFIDQVREMVHTSYPPGVLKEERKVVSFLLKKREDVVKQMTEFIKEKGAEFDEEHKD
jgi:hypothetical protein